MGLKIYLKCFMIFWCFAIAGCCSIPSNTPILIEKTSERIKIRSTVVTAVLRTMIDESTFTKDDVNGTKKILEGIDKSTLSQEDQESLEVILKNLTEIEEALEFNEKYSSVPVETERIFEEVVASLNLVQQITSTEVDKKALVQNMITVIEKSKGVDK